jgi:hypothetical protein
MKIKNKKLLLFLVCVIILTSQITCGNDNSTNSTNQTIPDSVTTNSTTNDPIVNPTVKNQTEIQEKDKFNILIYRSMKTLNKSEIGDGYIKYINFKEDLYVTPFKEFNNKFSPELKKYNQKIYDLGSYWFVIAGLSGLIFIIYVVLNRFFGKFRGSKKENLDADFKYWAWGVFCNLKFII